MAVSGKCVGRVFEGDVSGKCRNWYLRWMFEVSVWEGCLNGSFR